MARASSTETKRLLILSVSAGNGHVRAAEALAAGAAKWFPAYEVRHVDLLTLVPLLFRKTYKDSYIKLVQSHPALWGYLYAKADQAKADSALAKLRRAVESACSKPLAAIIQEYKPDHIICTHFMPLQVLARWRAKNRITQPVWTCITDFVAHRFWLEPNQAGYFTASEEDAWRLRLRGLTSEDVRAYGIPVMPQFIPPADPSGQKEARIAAARAFGFHPEKKIVLLMGGGAGVGDMRLTAEELLKLPSDMQLIALTGRNQSLLHSLEELKQRCPDRLFPLGFTSDVHQLLAAGDLVITKPGGLTTVECLAMGKPMLVYAPIPGQEEHNADYLLENGAALKAPDLPGLLWRVKRLIEHPELLPQLAAHAKALGKPCAARDILAHVTGSTPA